MSRETRILMGMPITVEIVGEAKAGLVDDVFAYFAAVDQRFSVFKPDSEISRINQNRLAEPDFSREMREVLALADRTKRESRGYFDIRRADGTLDPSGIVKGWAIRNAASLIRASGVDNFYVDAGGDIQSGGKTADGKDWRIGIRSPFNEAEIIKVLVPKGRGIATSGSYVRGHHIYDPYQPLMQIADIVSLTVIAADVLEADRFATAAFAMGKSGIHFLQQQPDLEGYVVSVNGVATLTSGFGAFVTS